MSTYTGDSTGDIVSVYTEFADGDAPDAASVTVWLEGLSDDVARLAVGKVAGGTQNIDKVMQVWHADEASFTTNANYTAVQVGAGGYLIVPLDLPDGADLIGASVRIKGAAGHGAFPGGAPGMPTMIMQKKHITTGAITTVGTGVITDASASAAAYEANHSLSDSAFSEIIDRELYVYYLRLAGEDAPNYIAGLEFISCVCTLDVTTIPVGAS